MTIITAILITWIIVAAIMSVGSNILLYLKWNKDNKKFKFKYLLILMTLSSICIFIFLPYYLIENKLNVRISKAYKAFKETGSQNYD